MLNVTVFDATNPIIVTTTSPISYNEGTTGHSITWNATDNYAATYRIYKNGSQIQSGSWTSGTAIVKSVDGLLKGTYNYTIVYYDASGNTVQDFYLIQVISNMKNIVLETQSLGQHQTHIPIQSQ